MNKMTVTTLSIVVGLTLVGGLTAYAFDRSRTETNSQNATAMRRSVDAKNEATSMASNERQTTEAVQDSSNQKSDSLSEHGSYVELEVYKANTSKYASSKKIYFFHASWCYVCQGIEDEINADISRLPAGVTFIKTDFDNARNLRKQYGVTNQYTFVQVDAKGNETAQWSATSLNAAIDGIKP